MYPDTKTLKKFIYKASQSTYASEDPEIRKKQPDGSTTITYTGEGDFSDFSYHDNYFGGEPYGGREVVSYKGKPIWIMVYYGWVVDGNDSTEIYPVLAKALRSSTVDSPYRGPKRLAIGDYVYSCDVKNDGERFKGIEKIERDGVVVFTTWFMGGPANL